MPTGPNSYGNTPIPSGKENLKLDPHGASDVGSAPKGSGKQK